MQWRFLPPVAGPGAFHMAADVAVLEAVRAGVSAPVLRFYRWEPACVTLGKFQPAEGNVRLDNCLGLGIDVVKRPTGGRAILHDHEVTFTIIVREHDMPEAGASIMDSYRELARALEAGMRRLGIPAELIDRHAQARGGDPASVMAAGNPACFAAKARCDLMVQGRKIIGSAQMRKDGIILQQNSLPLTVNYAQWESVFYRSEWQAVAESGAIDLFSAAGRPVEYNEVVEALRYGFETALDIEFTVGTLTEAEEQRARELLPEYTIINHERHEKHEIND